MRITKIKTKIKENLPQSILWIIYWYRARKMPLLQNVFNKKYNKNCLLSYITNPFIYGIKDSHQNSWQVIEIAKVISKYGYNIDVIDYNYNKTNFNKKYDLLIDIHPRDNATYNYFLKDECIKIAYLTGSNTSFSNMAEKKRLDNLYSRRKIKLLPRRRGLLISKKIENYDAAFFIGNEYNLKTYAEFKMPPVYFIKNTGYKFDFSNNKRDAKNFMFLGSVGQVHKGLDLLLEIFTNKLKDCNLYICSNFENEEDFCEEYKKELYHTSNIYPIGFIDIKSEKFKNLSEICAYMIMPSCSEGIAGSVLTAMSAGMIPLVSRECGLEDDEVIHLENCSMECIEETIKYYSNMDNEWVKIMSEKSVNIVLNKYSKENFIKTFEDNFKRVLFKNINNEIIN